MQYGFKIALNFLTDNYSSAERIVSIFIFTENSGNNLYGGFGELMRDIRMNYTFTINGFFYGESRSSNEISIPQFKDGGYYIIREKSEIPDIVKQIEKATEHPGMLDNVCQILFHLSKLNTPYYNASRDMLSPKYHCPKRIINDKFNSDSIINSKSLWPNFSGQ